MKSAGDFPRLPDGGPLIWAAATLAVVGFFFYLWPRPFIFLLLNGAVLGLVFYNVIAGRRYLKKADSSFILGAVVLILIALYGAFHNFGRLDPWVNLAQLFGSAALLYTARRLWAFRYARKIALQFSQTLTTDGKLEFADACRTFHRHRIGALSVAADLFREIAIDALKPGVFIRPAHVRAFQNYSHMLLFGEAKGVKGEGEWFGKQAQKLGKQLLESASEQRTLH